MALTMAAAAVTMAALTMAAAVTVAVSPLEPLGFAVVDAHVHLINTDNGIDYLWAVAPSAMRPPRQCPCRPPCLCNWTLADYGATSAASWAVDKVVFCEVDANTTQWLKEATWVQSLADRGVLARHRGGGARALPPPSVGAIVAQPPPAFGREPVGKYAHQLDKLGGLSLVTAVRPNLAGLLPNATADRRSLPLVIAGLQELGRRNLLVDLNLELGLAERLVAGAPGTRFVVEHLGGARTTNTSAAALRTWAAALRRLEQHPNVECIQLGGVLSAWGKAGAVDTDAVKGWVKAAIGIFGFGRVCFEGNWFFNNWGAPHANLAVYGLWASLLQDVFADMKATPQQKKAALRDNTIRAYRVV